MTAQMTLDERAAAGAEAYAEIVKELTTLIDEAHRVDMTALGQDLRPITKAVIRFGEIMAEGRSQRASEQLTRISRQLGRQ